MGKRVSNYTSQKIRVLNFIAILLVLYIHAVFVEAEMFPAANKVQLLCGFGGLSLLANPLFFCISGFLFFLGMERVNECYPKIRKRARTLLIPYLIWNIVFVLWFVVLQNLPGISAFINSDVVGSVFGSGLGQGFRYLFIKPAAFQLWFLRDLIIYVVLSPILFFFLKRTKWLVLVILFIASSLAFIFLSPEVKVWGLFFFAIGGNMALYHCQIENPKWVTLVCILLYLGNAALSTFVPGYLKGIETVCMLCGVIAIWGGYDLIVKTENSKAIDALARLGTYSFFVYCFHEPVLNIIKKVGLKVAGCNGASLIVLYLACPIVMYCVAVLVAVLLKRYVPKVYAVLTGGR